MELLRADALRRLRYEFPSTLLDFDECKRGSMIIDNFGISVAVANLAREQNLSCVLPLALYRCCCRNSFSARQLVTGIPGMSEALSADNLPTCFAGWTLLGYSQYSTTLEWTNCPNYWNCTSPAACAHIRKNALHEICFPLVAFVGHYSWSELKYNYGVDLQGGEYGMCSSCNSAAEGRHNHGRARF